MLSNIKIEWVKYKDGGGPRYLGRRDSGNFIHVYDPPRPWGVWTQILGVISACEGRYDTVVMYDGTGITFGFMQWTFTSGRLQRLLEYFKTIPIVDFDGNEWASSLFDDVCMKDEDTQVFQDFGFRIDSGKFMGLFGNEWVVLDPDNRPQRNRINKICMGIGEQGSTKGVKSKSQMHAMSLCRLFADIGQDIGVQTAQQEFAKSELKRSLDYSRPPLKDVGGKIRCLIPDELWGGPVPAIFFNLYQNSPGGSFKYMKGVMNECYKKGLVSFSDGAGFYSARDSDGVLEVAWNRLCKCKFADWGYGSRQYIESGKKNLPRITRIRPAIIKWYDVDDKLIRIKE